MSDNCLDDLTSMLRNLPAEKRALTERGLGPEAMDGNALIARTLRRLGCWPLLVLGGRPPLHMREMGAFQELDGVALYRPITKFADLITAAANIPESLARAVHVASSGEPGPVYLDVAEEALQTKAIAEHVSLPPPPTQLTDAVALDRAAEILANAERPVIIIGDGVRWSAPLAKLEQLVTRLDAPFITSPMGRGFLPDDHPLCFNATRSFLLADADAVLALGAKLDWTFRYGAEIARRLGKPLLKKVRSTDDYS